jgi:endonuclease YncB( thermonuclease family)
MRRMLVLLGLFLLSSACTPEVNLSGQVTDVADGDTVNVLLLGNDRARVRLVGIDAPEKGQPYGDDARRMLLDLAYQQRVSVRYETEDDFGRILGRLYVGDLDVNAELVRRGAAWAYRYQGRAAVPSFVALEAEAKQAGRGLWGLAEPPIAPSEWRRGTRPASTATPATRAPGGAEPFTCGTKNYCREMTSCEEARFYLTQCRLDTIDGDNNGIPCEAICR